MSGSAGSALVSALAVATATTLLVGLTARHLAHHRPRLRHLAAGAGLGLVALVVRLWGVPALARHVYDGHEAVYHHLFLHQQAPGVGDTTLYPALQWAWWLAGAGLPHHDAVPVVLSALSGSVAVVLGAAAAAALAGRHAAWAAAGAGALLALHPGHAAWSSSAYNVVLPGMLGTWALWAVARWRVAGGRALPLAATCAVAAAAGCRIELALLALPLGLLALDAAPRVGWRAFLAAWGPAVAAGAVLGGLAVSGVLGGELPGAGERALAWSNNLGFLAPWRPLDHGVGLFAVLAAVWVALFRGPRVGLVLVVGVVATHLSMATFDDYAQRHTLPALPLVAALVGLGVGGLRGFEGRRGVGIAAVVALALVFGGVMWAGLSDLRDRYYGEPEAFAAMLDRPPHVDLPRWERSGGRALAGQPDPVSDPACGWVAEDEHVASDPPRSHFNLLDPTEADALRGPDGCLRWCLDAQDWVWSSRGVRDRALRLSRLYTLQPAAVVVERDSGYHCLVLDVGPRR